MAFLICLCLPTVIHSLPGLVAGPVQLCGTQLSDFLGILCNFHYCSPESREKRETETDERFISEKKARSFLKLHRVHKRGIVNECCLKPCSLDELRTFCCTT